MPSERISSPLLLPFLRSARLWLALTACVFVGCGSDEPRPEVQPVSGQLFVGDQPAAGALLSFHPADGENFDERGSRPWAVVEPDGAFNVSTYGEHDGAPVGEYAVSVVWLENPDSPASMDKLGGRYARPDQSPWRVRIAEGENELEPFRIEGVRLERRARSGRSADPIDPVD